MMGGGMAGRAERGGGREARAGALASGGEAAKKKVDTTAAWREARAL